MKRVRPPPPPPLRKPAFDYKNTWAYQLESRNRQLGLGGYYAGSSSSSTGGVGLGPGVIGFGGWGGGEKWGKGTGKGTGRSDGEDQVEVGGEVVVEAVNTDGKPVRGGVD